jgi:hypothetical protein
MRTGMICTAGAIPDPPIPLLCWAWMIPATAVPWPEEGPVVGLEAQSLHPHASQVAFTAS